jgi:hypothetical protein
VRIPVLTNDQPASGLPLTVTGTSPPADGTVVVGPDAVLTYTPRAGWSGRDTFTYSATDGVSGSGTATVTVTAPPGARPDAASTSTTTVLTSDPARNLLGNDVCGTCTTALLSGPAVTPTGSAGSLTVNPSGTWTYNPTGVVSGSSVRFTYRATDSTTGLSSSAEVVIDVGDLGADRVTTPYGAAFRLDVLANDAACRSNGACKAQQDVAPTRGTATYPSSGSTNPYADYAPATGLWGLDSFRYRTSNSNSATVTVLVGPPAVSLSSAGGARVTAGVAPGYLCATCTFSLGTSPAKGTAAVAADGAISYTPATGAGGSDAFTYLVTHPSTGLVVTGQVGVTLGPWAVADSAAGVLGSPLSLPTAANDVCLPTCTRALVQAPVGMALAADGVLTWTPDRIGTVTAEYSLTSSTSGAAASRAVVTITVAGALDDVRSTPAGVPVAVDVRGNDPCTLCTLHLATQPLAGTAQVSGDDVVYTPRSGFSGVDSFRYELRRDGAVTSALVTVEVLPQAVPDAAVALEGRAVELRVLDNDLCGGCAVTSVSQPADGTASVLSPTLVRFVTGGAGTQVFSYELTDRRGATSTATVTVDVVARPVLADDLVVTAAGAAVDVPVLANDTCSGCSVDVGSDPVTGSVSTGASGGLVYSPAPGRSGRVSFTYIATDAATGASGTATVTVLVAPQAVDDRAWTAVGQQVSVDVQGNDACTGCTLTVVSRTGGEAADAVGGLLRVTPRADGPETVIVRYRVSDPTLPDAPGPDGQDLTASATVVVEVSDAQPDSAVTGPSTAVDVDVVANDVCVGCTVSRVDGPATAQGRTVTYAPSAVTAGLVVLAYEAGVDDRTVSSVLRVLVAPPVRTSQVPESGSLVGNVHDAAGTTPPTTCEGCTVRLSSGPPHGEIELAPDGGFTYQAPPGWVGSDAFGYVLTDPVSERSVEVVHRLELAAPPPPAPTGSVSLTTTASEVDPTVSGPADRHDAGDTVQLTHLVGNTGELELAQPLVTADRGGPVTCPASAVLPGEQRTCTSTLVLTQADLDAGTVEVGTSVSAQHQQGSASAASGATVPLVRSSSLASTVVAVPALDTTGTRDGADPGDVVTVTWTLTNTGSTTLRTPAVDDLECLPDSLLPGGTATCVRTVVLDADDVAAGRVELPGAATAQSPDGAVSSTAPSSTLLPATTTVAALSVTTVLTLQLTPVGSPTAADAGDRVAVVHTVRNTGDVALSGLVVSDPLVTELVCAQVDLAPGAAAECTGSRALDAQDLTAGTVASAATARAAAVDGRTPTATTSTTATLPQPPVGPEPPVTDPPVTDPPVTDPPVTDPPVTDPPVTDPPVTDPPVTGPPVTDPPVTDLPVTDPPVTGPPVADPPVSDPPVTDPPVSGPPVTDRPMPGAPSDRAGRGGGGRPRVVRPGRGRSRRPAGMAPAGCHGAARRRLG